MKGSQTFNGNPDILPFSLVALKASDGTQRAVGEVNRSKDTNKGIAAVRPNASHPSGGGPGDLHVVVRLGSELLFYQRDDAPPYNWHGPEVIP